MAKEGGHRDRREVQIGERGVLDIRRETEGWRNRCLDRDTKIWGEMKGGETHSGKRDGKVEGQVGGGSGRKGEGKRRKACSAEGVQRGLPWRPLPSSLLRSPFPREREHCPPIQSPEVWGGGQCVLAVIHVGTKVNKHTSPHPTSKLGREEAGN